jgi:hypothetical protein
VPAALMVGGLGWIIRRRMALTGLPVELQTQLERIVRKQRAALAAVGSGPPQYRRLGEDLKAVQAGAWTLARCIRRLRDARSRIDPASLVVQVGCLQHELARLTGAATRDAAETVLVEKRKALSILEEMERAEARCTLQLSSLEATLDTAYLILRQLPADDPTTPSVESVRRELEAEIAAIAEQELVHLERRWL